MRRLPKFLLLAVLLGVSACDGEPVPLQKMPDIKIATLDGKVEPLSQWRGKKIILNVWATWCAPCREEMPALEMLSQSLNPEEFIVLGVSIDNKTLPVKEFLRRTGIKFARHIDRRGNLMREALGIVQIPQTLIIDPSGNLVTRVVGVKEWKKDDVVDTFSKMGM